MKKTFHDDTIKIQYSQRKKREVHWFDFLHELNLLSNPKLSPTTTKICTQRLITTPNPFCFLFLQDEVYLNNTYIAIQKQPAPTKGDMRSPIRLSFQQNPPKPKIGSGRIAVSENENEKIIKIKNFHKQKR
jgi:hypothetical protein